MSEPLASALSHLAPPPGLPLDDALARVRHALKPGVRVRTMGLAGAARGHVLARLSTELHEPLLCITPDDAKRVARLRPTFTSESTMLILLLSAVGEAVRAEVAVIP